MYTARQNFEEKAGRWLSTRNLARHQPTRGRYGEWRITLPAKSFGEDAVLPLNKLGSFVVLETSFFHVWCSDERARREALLARLDSMLGPRNSVDRDTVESFIAKLSHQLGLGNLDVADLPQAAVRAGRRSLADQLRRLS
ncbi:hypothetical protein [Streptomyces aidingensis]|uniref:Uncharacterized protein n=1 Tax=Streptomyces aidingensis TaxID=910347 RepID=A0A1I1SHQ3_9ACTN|nr:hypothetical protein [Streptomyces aidingensis]SFD43373.1 hypothetical protein SAMN05421773_11544 [Streptomyces aidingensis]